VWARARHEGIFAAGHKFAEEFDGRNLASTQFQLGLGCGVTIRGTDLHLVVELDEHEIIVVHGRDHGGHADAPGLVHELGGQILTDAHESHDLVLSCRCANPQNTP
jgi:hypothetical protein